MNYYVNYKDKYGFTYSIDMIRLNFELNMTYEHFLDGFYNFLTVNNCAFRLYFGHGGTYKYLYNIDFSYNDNVCSCAIGFCLHGKKENLNRGFIEFNPNKNCSNFTFNKFYEWFCKYLYSLTCVRYDLAVDIPVSREKVKLIRNSLCNYRRIESVIDGSITEYQGCRSHNKYTKLYDKSKESKLDYDLTRLEYTFNIEEQEYSNLPSIYIYSKLIAPELDFSQLTSNDIVLIDLLRNSEDINFYLTILGYKKKKKIEPFLHDLDYTLDLELAKKIREEVLLFEI